MRFRCIAMLALISCATPPPPVVVKDLDFKEELRRHGEWIVVAPYGRVWHPNTQQVGPNFVPYLTGGGWVHAADGWNFETSWKWGQFVFHYGRWFVADDLGWLWWPDQARGTAFVQWRGGDGYTGWAPLPPELKTNRVAKPAWAFTKTRYLSARDAPTFQVKPEDVAHILEVTADLPATGPDAKEVSLVGGLDREVELPVIAPPPEPAPEPVKEEEPPPPPPKKKIKPARKKH